MARLDITGLAYAVFVPAPDVKIEAISCFATSTSASLPPLPKPIMANLPFMAKLMLPGPMFLSNVSFLTISCFSTSMIAVKSLGGELANRYLPSGVIFMRPHNLQSSVLTILASAMFSMSTLPSP